MPLTNVDLQKLVGKTISDICANKFASPAQNHCAHFVGHALGITLGVLCGDMKFETKRTGASIRCDELYNNLQQTGPWAKKPAKSDRLLIFVISSRHMTNGVMMNVPQKHVGIHFGGSVYNFSNAHHKVVVDTTVDAFHKKFKNLYHGGDISLYYGVAP